jgi:hypothetical protein
MRSGFETIVDEREAKKKEGEIDAMKQLMPKCPKTGKLLASGLLKDNMPADQLGLPHKVFCGDCNLHHPFVPRETEESESVPEDTSRP